MYLKMKLLMLLSLSLLLAACTTTSSSPSGSSDVSVTTDAATAVSATPINAMPDPASQQFYENGITFTYDPALLGEAQVQEIPAMANQGLFEQPSPAHTWIGFVPADIQPEISNHWFLAWEPSLTFYNLNDFGSFALSDQYARDRVAQFQALAAERPSTISEQIPVIPPINSGQIIRAQVKWLDFGNGTGVRFVTQYDQAVNPINNEGLVYIFQGITTDGLHGVTAVFPLDNAGLPDGPAMSEPEYTAFIENFDAEMTAVTDLLNSSSDEEFNPPLSRLDTLLQSLTITPLDTDFSLTVLEPAHGHVLADTDIFTSPTGAETNGRLQAGDAVVVNATSEDGRRNRILCPDGATGNCWVAADALQTNTVEADPFLYVGDFPRVGDAVQVTAVTDNDIYEGPGKSYQHVGALLTNESVEVFGADDTGQWLAVVCPRNIGETCWVTSDPAINEPTGYFGGDGWQEVSSAYVSFRVPEYWQPTAVSPGMGSVLAEWHLGIPDVESDQSIAFFSSSFADLKPNDIISEYPIEIGGEPGLKWVRGDQGYTSYDYYTSGTSDTLETGAGSFGLHVTLSEADPDLESVLDMVAASVIFMPTGQENANFRPRFDHYLPFTLLEDGSSLTGLTKDGNGWQIVSVPYPADMYYSNIDYAPATDRLLVWQSLEGAGPGNLSVGPLSIINLATQAQQTVVTDNVVSAGWAPNGLDFAYILATPDTYELRWRQADGNDRLLAVDVPHTLRVSADGRLVAFTRESHYGLTTAVPGLYVVNAETGKETQISTLDRAGYGGIDPFWKPIWSPDSSQLILYATADSDRATTPHDAGYVWAAADGSFSHFFAESVFLNFFDNSLSSPENVPCLDIPPLFAADRMILRVGECRPMVMVPEFATTIDFALDAEKGTVQMQQSLSALTAAELLTWEVPGESLLLYQDGEVITLSLKQ